MNDSAGDSTSSGWAEDLSYDYYRRLVETLQERFVPIQLRDAPSRGASDKPHAILRHDVDVCLEAALRMARLEHGMGMRATYLLMVNSPLYSIETPRSRAIINELLELGHEIALHFDPEDYPRPAAFSLEAVEEHILASAERLSQISGQTVRSVSFHRPAPEFLRGPTYVGTLVNAYAKELMDWYLSDSGANWREGEPISQILRPRCAVLQILVHPIWWGKAHMSCEGRLDAYHREHLAAGHGNANADELDELIYQSIALRRRPRN